ncbi:MAG: G8 domain-containing protein [Planctomycetota bacterium]
MRISLPAIAVLIGVFLLPVHGQVTSVASGNWSNSATWGGTPPTAGDVTIAAGHVVTLDVDVPALGAVGIDGTLVFGAATAPAIRQLGATDLRVRNGGRLEVGTATTPFPGRASITLHADSGNPGLLGVEYGGAIEMVATLGSASSHTTLQTSLAVSATSATVIGNPGWTIGDRIVVASTDYDCRQAETFIIQSVTPLTGMTTYGLDHAASYLHFVGELAPWPPRSPTPSRRRSPVSTDRSRSMPNPSTVRPTSGSASRRHRPRRRSREPRRPFTWKAWPSPVSVTRASRDAIRCTFTTPVSRRGRWSGPVPSVTTPGEPSSSTRRWGYMSRIA